MVECYVIVLYKRGQIEDMKVNQELVLIKQVLEYVVEIC